MNRVDSDSKICFQDEGIGWRKQRMKETIYPLTFAMQYPCS